MKKKLVCAFLSLTLCMPAGSISVLAHETPEWEQPVQSEEAASDSEFLAQGMLGSAEWTISSDGVLTIGPGLFKNENSEYVWPWMDYRDQIVRIDGTAPFTAFGDFSKAFAFGTWNEQRQEYDSVLESADLSG